MNPRILKKLSALAAPLLPILGDRRQQFRAEKGENYHGVFIADRRHWNRARCHPTYEAPRTQRRRADPIVYSTRAGHRVCIRPPYEPLKSTIMVGCVSGYFEPEWVEETAWEALSSFVYGFFTDFGPDGEVMRLTQALNGPGDILKAARWIAAQTQEAFR